MTAMNNPFETLLKPLLGLLTPLTMPLFVLVAVVGFVYCVLLALRLRRAEKGSDAWQQRLFTLRNGLLSWVAAVSLIWLVRWAMLTIAEWL